MKLVLVLIIFTIFLAGVFFIFNNTRITYSSDAGLIGYWKFEGNFNDSSGNGNTGTGSGTGFTDGQVGQAADFDGNNDWVDLHSISGSLNESTITFWFRKEDIDEGAQYFLDGRNSGNWWFLQDYVSGECDDPNGNICFYGLVEIESSDINNDTWHHVALTTSPLNTKIYLDGNLIDTGDGIVINLSSVRIGTEYTNRDYFDGLIDELKIYNYARSASQIIDDYDGLAAYWQFDEGGGDDTDDETTNNNIGDRRGASWEPDSQCANRGCLSFDGNDDCVVIPDDDSLDVVNDITLEAWFKNEGIGAGPNIGMIMAKHYTNGNRSYNMHLRYDSNKLRFEVIDTGDNAHYLDSDADIINNLGYHVAATYKKSTGEANIYINGELDNNANFGSFDLMQSNTPATVGCYVDNPGDGSNLRSFLLGKIDEVKIFNSARTAAQISEDYAASLSRRGFISGWAWSSNFGWISFDQSDCDHPDYEVCRDQDKHCIGGADEGDSCNIDSDCDFNRCREKNKILDFRCDTGSDCTTNGGLCGDWCLVCDNDGTTVCESVGNLCINGGTCVRNSYRVKVDTTTGNFTSNVADSPYAWSPNFGWIDFEPSGPYPNDPQYSARYEYGDAGDNKRVTGWAKVLSLEDEGWIKMSDDSIGVWDGQGVKIDVLTGDFSGWAWAGSDVDFDDIADISVGWISFNSNDCDLDGNNFVDAGACEGDNVSDDIFYYKANVIINTPPVVSALTAPNWDFGYACSDGALDAILRWQFFDIDYNSSQSAYQVIIDNDNNPADPLFDTTKRLGPANQITVSEENFPDFSYNTSYYWWVRVWDNYDIESDLVQYISSTDTDNEDGNNETFTTYRHEFPDVHMSWVPFSPSRDEEVEFTAVSATNMSHYYLNGTPNTPFDCDEANCLMEWTIPDSQLVEGDLNASTTVIVKFISEGPKHIELRITNRDGSDYYCIETADVNLNYSLPIWKEVKSD